MLSVIVLPRMYKRQLLTPQDDGIEPAIFDAWAQSFYHYANRGVELDAGFNSRLGTSRAVIRLFLLPVEPHFS